MTQNGALVVRKVGRKLRTMLPKPREEMVSEKDLFSSIKCNTKSR